MKQIERKKTKQIEQGKKTKQTKLYFWMLIILLIVGVFLVNLVLGVLNDKRTMSVDLTSNELFDISQESKDFISSLTDKIEVHVLAKEGDFIGTSTYMAQANEIIQLYGKFGPTITVDYVNYVADPTFASKYPDVVMSHGDILVSCGDKHRVIITKELFNYTYDSSGKSTISSSKADQVLSSAILNVTSDEQVLVSILTGNGEYTMS